MTPLIAGIALQGSPPMYEGFVKAKDSAKAKADEDRRKRGGRLKELAVEGISFDPEVYHPHYRDKASDLFVEGVDKVLSSIDPNDPYAENKMMLEMMGLNKRLSSYKGASDVLFKLEDEAFRGGHYVPDEAVSWFNNNPYGSEVPPEIQEQLDFNGIDYRAGENPSVDPFVSLNTVVIKKDNTYIRDYQSVLGKMKGEWDMLEDEAKYKILGNRKIETLPSVPPFEMVEPILLDMSSDRQAVVNLKNQTGLDIRTPEGRMAFYETYSPSEYRTLSGTFGRRGGRGGNTNPPLELSKDDLEIVVRAKNGEYRAPYNNAYATEKSSALFNRSGGFVAGEYMDYRRLGEGVQKYEVANIGQVPIYRGDKTFNVPLYAEGDRTFGPFTIKPGDPVPYDLRDYISEGNVEGVSPESISNEWYFRAEGAEDYDEGKTGTTLAFIPANPENVKLYLKSIGNKTSQRQEAQRLKDLGLISGSEMNDIMRSAPTGGGSKPSGSGSKVPRRVSPSVAPTF